MHASTKNKDIDNNTPKHQQAKKHIDASKNRSISKKASKGFHYLEYITMMFK